MEPRSTQENPRVMAAPERSIVRFYRKSRMKLGAVTGWIAGCLNTKVFGAHDVIRSIALYGLTGAVIGSVLSALFHSVREME